MFNITLRYRMKKIISMLEKEQNIFPLLQNKKYLKAFKALEVNSYVQGFYVDNCDIPYHVALGTKGPIYLLERSELWMNRIAGFICGILTSVIVGYLLKLL